MRLDRSTPPQAGEQIRPASPSDQQKIADLIFFESHVHRHLDWRTPLDWLGFSPYWVFEEGRQISGALACPPDPRRGVAKFFGNPARNVKPGTNPMQATRYSPAL